MNLGTNNYISVGQVDKYGFIEFLESSSLVNNYELVGNRKPSIFYPEFYTDYISSIDKKEFTPKNIPTQLVSLVGSVLLEPKDYYVTGYVTNDGIAVYYDQ